jgi:hypothetical protein
MIGEHYGMGLESRIGAGDGQIARLSSYRHVPNSDTWAIVTRANLVRQVDFIMAEVARTQGLVFGEDIVPAPADMNWTAFMLENPNSTLTGISFLDRGGSAGIDYAAACTGVVADSVRHHARVGPPMAIRAAVLSTCTRVTRDHFQ